MGLRWSPEPCGCETRAKPTSPPHSLKLEASIGRTLSMASSLSTRDRSSTDGKDGGATGRGRGPFPFSACFGAMAMKQAERKIDWKGKAGPRGSREIGGARRGRRKNNCVRGGGCIARRIQGQHGEAETPTSNQPPRGDQGRRLLGPAALRTCPLASLLSQVRACFGPGATVGVLGTGVSRLACLWSTAWLC